MPVYEFKCADCEHVFSELRKMGDFTSGPCPKCKKNNTEKIFSLFSGSGSGGDSCGTCAPSPGG